MLSDPKIAGEYSAEQKFVQDIVAPNAATLMNHYIAAAESPFKKNGRLPGDVKIKDDFKLDGQGILLELWSDKKLQEEVSKAIEALPKEEPKQDKGHGALDVPMDSSMALALRQFKEGYIPDSSNESGLSAVSLSLRSKTAAVRN